MREYNFDGLVGPTHAYSGLSPGNLLSLEHAGTPGDPKRAALEGLSKMRFMSELGVAQAVLPPQPRPDVTALSRLGFGGDPEAILARARVEAPRLLVAAASASAMWTANAATISPSSDTLDRRLHLTVANLSSLFHRSLEAPVTRRVLGRIFADAKHFVVHDPLPSCFADEGAANHTRLVGAADALHLFAWGFKHFESAKLRPQKFIAHQSLEAAEAIARRHGLTEGQTLFWQQAPQGIDAGAFHTDVLAVGNEGFLMLHELAFVDTDELLAVLRQRLGEGFTYCVASQAELPVDDAVRNYPFNSQIVTLRDGNMAIIAPAESKENAACRAFLERIVAEENRLCAIHYVDVNASMHNGGGPACLRLRVPLSSAEATALGGRVILDDSLYQALTDWVLRHYRDRLSVADLADPKLLIEVQTALDELTQLLGLNSVYDFQTVA